MCLASSFHRSRRHLRRLSPRSSSRRARARGCLLEPATSPGFVRYVHCDHLHDGKSRRRNGFSFGEPSFRCRCRPCPHRPYPHHHRASVVRGGLFFLGHRLHPTRWHRSAARPDIRCPRITGRGGFYHDAMGLGDGPLSRPSAMRLAPTLSGARMRSLSE